MLRRAVSLRRVVASAAVAVSVVGCGGGGPPGSAIPASPPNPGDSASSPVATATTSLTPTQDPTAEPTPSASRPPPPTPSPATYASEVYRYAITLPPGTQRQNWRPARLWDGTSKLDMAGPYTDRTTVAEGTFFLFGAEAESLDSWFVRVEENGVRYHGCKPAQNRVDVTINDVPAIAFTQSCALETHMARIALWKDGYGIGAWLGPTAVGGLVSTRNRAVELLSTLEWRLD